MFDERKANRALKVLRVSNALCWFLTILLFSIPVWQYVSEGKVPFDIKFVIVTAANIGLVVISIYLASRIKFKKYQINYFSSEESN
jgi:hypothetical protein